MILKPQFLVADEPVSALDVSIQAQIITLLKELKDKLNLTILFISHDLGVVKYLSDRIAVMYLGDIVELAKADELFKDPRHPYTQALISAVPSIHKKQGEEIKDICSDIKIGEPKIIKISDSHYVKCHLYD